MNEINQTICRYDWDDVFYAIRSAYAEYSDGRARHEALANARGIPTTDYLAAKLTRAAQETIDFTFQSDHDWKAVFQVARTVCLDFEEYSREEWIAQARHSRLSRGDLLAARLTRYMGETIDFNDFLRFNMLSDSASRLESVDSSDGRMPPVAESRR